MFRVYGIDVKYRIRNVGDLANIALDVDASVERRLTAADNDSCPKIVIELHSCELVVVQRA